MTDFDSMFKRRTPEAVARQLSVVLMNLLECEIATLEGLRMKKSTSKYELRRHESIVKTHLEQVIDLDIPPETRGLRGLKCGRVMDALNAAPAAEGLE